MDLDLGERYWNDRYLHDQTGWDAQEITPPLREYFDQLGDKSIKILIPGCGNAHEARHLFNAGFTNTHLLDIAATPLLNFAQVVPGFPKDQLVHSDFFEFDGQFDLIVEQTFFCSLNRELRPKYVRKMYELLTPGGKLVGLLFNNDLQMVKDRLGPDHPPYGGSKEEYAALFEALFSVDVMELSYNSLKPRQGNELFIKLIKKD